MLTQAKPYISRIDKSFKEDYSRNFQLTILLSLDGFSFSIFSPEKQRFVGLEVYHFSKLEDELKLAAMLDEIVMNRPWIAYPYQSVVVLVDNTASALVPAALFDEKEKGTFLAFNQTYKDNSRIATDKLKNADAVNVYYLANMLAAKIKDLWANATIVHISTVLIESLLIGNKHQNIDSKVFVNVRKNVFDMVVIRNQKLLFYNTFKFSTKEDFIYFLLFAMEQLRLNPEKIELILSGLIEKSSEIFGITERYIRTIKFIERNKIFEYSYVLDELAWHHNSLLYNVMQCEL